MKTYSLNWKSPSNGYLTVVSYRLFSKVKINLVITFASNIQFPKFLHQAWFTNFSVNYTMNPITEVIDTLL